MTSKQPDMQTKQNEEYRKWELKRERDLGFWIGAIFTAIIFTALLIFFPTPNCIHGH